MIVLMATAGRPDSVEATLGSICAASRPSSFEAIIVIENGTPSGAEEICSRLRAQGEPVRFTQCASKGKSLALNHALASISDDTLVVMTDDDIRFEPGTLVAYDSEAGKGRDGRFFGGPLDVHYEEPPPEWLRGYLPPSATGWHPTNFDPRRNWFLGCNWACYAGDLKRIGGFDSRYGPGSQTGATGQETEMQSRLRRAGLVGHLIPDAVVSHFVPRHHCSPAWVIARARRNGISRGLTMSQRQFHRRLIDHCRYGFRLLAAPAPVDEAPDRELDERHFRSAFYRTRSIGYFEGVRLGRAA